MLRKFRIYGQVQGVGFRFFTRRKAIQLNLTGSVRNLADGSVEVVAQGEEAQINLLRNWLAQGSKSAVVKRVVSMDCPERDFFDFSILP